MEFFRRVVVFTLSVFKLSVFKPSVFKLSVFTPSVFKLSVFKPSVFTPSAFKLSVLTLSVGLVLVVLSPRGAVALEEGERAIVVFADEHSHYTNEIYHALREGLKERGRQERLILASLPGLEDREFFAYLESTHRFVLRVGLSSRLARELSSQHQQAPLLFVDVRDPVADGLVDSLERPGGNATGVATPIDLERQLDLFLKIKPQIKAIGIVFDPGDRGALSMLARMDALARERNFDVHKAPAFGGDDIQEAAISLIGRVEAIYAIDSDNFRTESVRQILRIGTENNLPVITDSARYVADGALIALDFNYHVVGDSLAELVTRALKGEPVGTIPVMTIESTVFDLNATQARALGLYVSETLHRQARQIY